MADWDTMMAIAGDCVGIFSRRTTTFENQAPIERTVCSSLHYDISYFVAIRLSTKNVILNR